MFRALPIVSFCFLVLGGVYLAGSLELPMGSAARPGAGLYPFLVGITLVALSAPLFIRSLKLKETQQERAEPFPRGKDRQRVMAAERRQERRCCAAALALRPVPGYG